MKEKLHIMDFEYEFVDKIQEFKNLHSNLSCEIVPFVKEGRRKLKLIYSGTDKEIKIFQQRLNEVLNG